MICTAVMNRWDVLEETIENWLGMTTEEIVLVDWSCRFPVKNRLKVDSRINIIRINDQKYFRMTQAFNIAMTFFPRDICYKMDIDYRITKDDFLDIAKPSAGEFVHGSWQNILELNDRYLNGFLALRQEDFIRVHGYDERLTRYGYDDCDLYSRLGLESRVVTRADGIIHVPHGKDSRIRNFEYKTLNTNINRKMTESEPWVGPMKQWTFVQKDENYFENS